MCWQNILINSKTVLHPSPLCAPVPTFSGTNSLHRMAEVVEKILPEKYMKKKIKKKKRLLLPEVDW